MAERYQVVIVGGAGGSPPDASGLKLRAQRLRGAEPMVYAPRIWG